MQFQYIPYIWTLAASAFITFYLGLYTLIRRRNAKGAISFILSMFVVTIWSSGNALEMSALDFGTKLFWANMQYFAYCYSPVTLLALCMGFTSYDKWINNKRIIWLAVIPTIIIILVWTDGLHSLIRYDMHMDYSGLFPVISKEYGPVFYIHAVYSYLLNFIAWILLIKAVFIKNTVYRKQAFALFLGLSLIILPNILYISGVSPVKRFDITPIFFGPAGLIMSWGILRFKMFDLIPLARATVIETMEAGVMVLDLQDRVLDVNPAFEKILGLAATQVSTKGVGEALDKIPELVKACMDRSITHTEFSINNAESIGIYEVLLSPLNDRKGILIGRLAVIYDITEKKQAQQEFLKHQWKLAVTEERERMSRDLHDNMGQVLGFINLQAQGIRQELSKSGVEVASAKLDTLINVTQEAHSEIREYIRNARSVVFMEKDFITALEKEILKLEEQTGIRIKLEIPTGFTGEKLEPAARFNMLNIIKEALNNVGKHAEADSARVYFSITQHELTTTIEDNGKGFDSSIYENPKDKRFGLTIMRERAAVIGANIHIQSSPGKGSRIILHLPLVET
jgi:PAS domain S-box-containing protein